MKTLCEPTNIPPIDEIDVPATMEKYAVDLR
jgi:hypothetical protein